MKTSYQSQESTPRFKKKELNMITQALHEQIDSKKRKQKDKELKTLQKQAKKVQTQEPSDGSGSESD